MMKLDRAKTPSVTVVPEGCVTWTEPSGCVAYRSIPMSGPPDVAVNEHPIVDGETRDLPGEIEHHDSPNLHHWFDKQNRYSTAEALAQFQRGAKMPVVNRIKGPAKKSQPIHRSKSPLRKDTHSHGLPEPR